MSVVRGHLSQSKTSIKKTSLHQVGPRKPSLKNPVAAIRAAAEALQGQPEGVERTRTLATVIEDAGERLDRFVHQFFELARAEAGLGAEAREPVDLVALAGGVVESVRADPRWARLGFGCTHEGEATLIGVSARLETALRNLVDNAASFATGRVACRCAAAT